MSSVSEVEVGFIVPDRNAAQRRKELGNGHLLWLKNYSIPWDITKAMGNAWNEMNNSGAPIDVLIRSRNILHNLSKQSCLSICEDIQKEFNLLGLDPLSLNANPGTPWYNLAFQSVAMECIDAYNNGEIPTKEMITQFINAGALNSHIFYANYNAWDYGSQTFAITFPLASKLLLTDIGHVTWKDFHPPFPAFVIQLPPSLAAINDSVTGRHPLDTIIIVNGTIEGRRRIEMFFMGQENKNSANIGDDATLYLALLCDDEDKTIEEAISLPRPPLTVTNSKANEHSAASVASITGLEAIHQLMRFACSLTLYITSHPDDRRRYVNPEVKELHDRMRKLKGSNKPKKIKQKEALGKKLERLAKQSRPLVVGTNVTISPQLEKIAKAIGQGKALPLDIASYVRGHHKMQAHGPQHSLRKHKWIEPYWRGIEHATTSQKTYTVK